MSASLRLNMTGHPEDAAARAERYQAAVEMAAYADAQGFSLINLEEHHCAANGWLPSPLTMAAAIAARTERANIVIAALLVSLYDPIRLAEDLAVVDLLSQGRMSFVAGMGYRELEFHAMDKPFAERGQWMDHVLETLLNAWSGEPFEYRGKTIQVTPQPYSRPHPMMLVGGMSKPAARRAARLGLPFYPAAPMPAIEAVYYQELEKAGKQGFVYTPPEDFSLLFIDPDPEAAWEELGPYILSEFQEYSSWCNESIKRPLEMQADSVEAIRAEARYEIITPEECLERYSEREGYNAALHPLIGGIPLNRAWDCLKLFSEEVLAKR